MIPKVRRKLWIYVHGNKKLGSKSQTSVLINSLYPDKKRKFPDLIQEYGQGVKSTLSRLKHKGFVIKDGSSYSLSGIGRWFAIANQLGITFLELCALACACCVQERLETNGKEGFYLFPSFEEIFKRYYSKWHLQRVFVNLRKKFAVKISKKSLRIYPKLHKKLMGKYGEQLRLLELWLDQIQEREHEIISGIADMAIPTLNQSKQKMSS